MTRAAATEFGGYGAEITIGAKINTNTIVGAPYEDFSIIYPQTLF